MFTPGKRAPSLQARLAGDASIYKPFLERERLRDPSKAVDYFKHDLRPHFAKGVGTVFIFSYSGITDFRGFTEAHRTSRDGLEGFMSSEKRIIDA